MRLRLPAYVLAIAAALSATAYAHEPESAPGPGGPQLEDLPGYDQVPNVSRVPGAPQLQGLTTGDQNTVTDPAIGGVFGAPFEEPGERCDELGCKPAAVSVVVLPNGKVLYWDGLEGQERIKYSIVTEFGEVANNDQSRLLDLSGPSWLKPDPVDGGADGSADTEYLVQNAPEPLKEILNHQGIGAGALFCSGQVLLANGQAIVPGGTDYYLEPHVPGTGMGVSELQGLKNTRVYDARTNSWYQTGSMHYGRWYPGLVTLGDGRLFVASGVTKLLKPVYTKRPLLSGTNVRQTEIFDPRTGEWTDNGAAGARTMPLYPRLHLLPNGHVFYNAGGQAFNPFGQSYDEALWNLAASYDPEANSWTTLGVPLAGLSVASERPTDAAISAGFRGSAFSALLPLEPPYDRAQILSAGGVLGTTPGVYLANTSSAISTVEIGPDGSETFTSEATPPLNNARWFSSAVSLPTGQVMITGGANRDDVVGPGSSFPVTQAELFDPETGEWTQLADARVPRTYHNSAVLLPSAKVLIGGNAPITTMYAWTTRLPGGFSNAHRDASFQIYEPPYLHWGIPQPKITDVGSARLGWGEEFTLKSPQAKDLESVVLVRNAAFTHITDNDQRTVVLPVKAVQGSSIRVATPDNPNVLPPGPYLLFFNQRTEKGVIPSQAKQVFVGEDAGPVPPRPSADGTVPAN